MTDTRKLADVARISRLSTACRIAAKILDNYIYRHDGDDEYLRAALIVLQSVQDTEQCTIEEASSRTCQKGIKGCIVPHTYHGCRL